MYNRKGYKSLSKQFLYFSNIKRYNMNITETQTQCSEQGGVNMFRAIGKIIDIIVRT